MKKSTEIYEWELEKARSISTSRLKDLIWLSSIGQPIPGCMSVESLRAVLIERGEDGKGYHES